MQPDCLCCKIFPYRRTVLHQPKPEKYINTSIKVLQRDAMYSANYAVAMSVCPSVCPSVTGRYCIETVKRIIKLFPLSGSHTILAFLYQTLRRYSDGDPLTETSNAGGVCTTNISLHIGNDLR